ncbi:MAG: hypothetical protein V4480_01550 [Patescibacteria group bacterium]
MKSDFVLFLAILIFIFVLWLYTGGPTHPISFAGPYLTPVTTSGGQSQAYGNPSDLSGGSFLHSLSSGFGKSGSLGGDTSGSSNISSVPAGDQSPYAGKVHINGGDPSATSVRQEYLALQSASGSGNINITGWQLVSTQSGAQAVIRAGERIPDVSSESSIVLNPGDEAIVTTGQSPYRSTSFKENKCTGYLDSSSYSPSLSTSNCPAPIDELGDFYSGNANHYDDCADYVRTLSSCRVPGTSPQGTPSFCRDFVRDRLDYSGCVDGHKNDADFVGDTWRIYLDENKQLWRSDNDTIRLLDQNGKVVDQYSY